MMLGNDIGNSAHVMPLAICKLAEIRRKFGRKFSRNVRPERVNVASALFLAQLSPRYVWSLHICLNALVMCNILIREPT